MGFLKSFSGRVFIILFLGVLSATMLTWWLAFGERQRTISQFREFHALERAEQLLLAIDALPAENRAAFLETAPRLGLRIAALPVDTNQQSVLSPYAQALSERLGAKFKVFSLKKTQQDCPDFPRENHRHLKPPSCEAIGIILQDGHALHLTTLPARNSTPPLRPDFQLYLMLYFCSIGVLAFLVSRMTMRPLNLLAQAAINLGNDINRPPLPETGATEILQASKAFNAMQARLRQHISQRTHMLGAITHDLQTPLTRLRLRLEKVSDHELREKLIQDLSDMQSMVKEGLDLARSMDNREGLKPLDLISLLDSVCNDAIDAGQNVRFTSSNAVTVMAKPQALRRCLNNLIDNAIKYGHQADLTIVTDLTSGMVEIKIRDKGCGIPEDQIQQVFEPFYRVETSRSRDTGGTGLGLTIAQNIAQQHGGSLTLRNLAEGGLETTLRLPYVKP